MRAAAYGLLLVIFTRDLILPGSFFPRTFRLWIPKRCKGVDCVDLGESFPTSIYLQNLASIQPRTSLVKFARSPRTDPPGGSSDAGGSGGSASAASASLSVSYVAESGRLRLTRSKLFSKKPHSGGHRPEKN